MNEIEQLKEQHFSNYKKAITEIIVNNTISLIDDDINSLFRIPPLDSMDVIKCKFLSMAKKEKIILNTDCLNKIICLYRNEICKRLEDFKNLRIEALSLKLNSFIPVKEYDVFKLSKKELLIVDKKLKESMKLLVNELLNTIIINKIDSIFDSKIDISIKETIIKDCTKYLKKDYVKQLFENVDVKLIVKNTTLINGLKEQGERYIFTNENSRLLNVN